MKQKVVFITGASRGLGKALAEKFLEENYIVCSGVRDLSKAPKGTHPIALDLTREETLSQAVNDIISSYGKIDILINNAGIAYVGPVDSMTTNEARDLFEVNFFGPFRLTQLVLPYMRKQKSGKILFVSSTKAVESGAYIGMYSASKAALEAIAFDWAVTLSKWNISVSVAQPGPIDTGIEFKHGNYFQDQTPYPTLENISLKLQTVNSARDMIIKNLTKAIPPYRFQTNNASETIIAQHLVCPSGETWCKKEADWFDQL